MDGEAGLGYFSSQFQDMGATGFSFLGKEKI
jgi:hypothetical protein